MSAILEGERYTPDTLIRAEVTTQGIDIDIFQGEKGVVKITLSEKKWNNLVKYITKKCEHLQRLKKGGNDG